MFSCHDQNDEDGGSELRLRCAFRRGDIAASLLGLAEKRYAQYFTSMPSTLCQSSLLSATAAAADQQQQQLNSTTTLAATELRSLKHRELFYSRYIESDVATSVLRGKLALDKFMPHVNTLGEYARRPDKFFYQLTYEPNSRQLMADSEQVRVGARYQADIPDLMQCSADDTRRQRDEQADRGELVWSGADASQRIGDVALRNYVSKALASERLADALGTAAQRRGSVTTRTRDTQLYDALQLLAACAYDRKQALKLANSNELACTSLSLVNSGNGGAGGWWTPAECSSFEQGMRALGKQFAKICDDYVNKSADTSNSNSSNINNKKNVKSLADCVAYYYNVYKSNSEYVAKRALKRESKKGRLIELRLPRHPNDALLADT